MRALPLIADEPVERPPARHGLAAQVSGPLRRYLGTEQGGAMLALAAVVLALGWASSPWSGAYHALLDTPARFQLGSLELGMDLQHWVDDGLMAIFFFVVGLEVRRELALGELTDRRRVVVPLVAGVLGCVVPALAYLALNGGGPGAQGWGVVVGTDTAFVLGALAVVGPRQSTQLRLFLLTLSVIDDVIAVTVIGVAYSERIDPWALGVACAALLALVALGRARVWRSAPYLLVLAVLWLAALRSGLHPSIAGMLGGLLVPAVAPRRADVEGAARLARAFRQSPLPSVGRDAQRGLVRAVSVNERLQEALHPWAAYVVVPAFALANAGVDLRGEAVAQAWRSPVFWGVVLGLVVGKLVGVGLGTAVAVRARWGRLPQGVGPGAVAGGAALSGIGFTVSLLIAGLAFRDDPTVRTEAVTGVLVAGVLALALGRLAFWLAARLLGERTADLPRVLAVDVDPGRDHVRGPADAPVTLVEYLDYECPFCAKATGVAREVREHFGDRLRYVARHLPLPDVHPHAEAAALAVEAAGRQGRFWEMHDLLFTRQDRLDADDLVAHAGDLGLDVEQFLADLDDPALGVRVREDVAGAEASGARGTPTFFVGRHRHIGPHDAATLIAALERATRESSPARGS